MTRHVATLAEQVWNARHGGTLTRDARLLAQKLHVATASDVAESEHYDPETDDRVAWLREIIAQVRRRPGRTPRASDDAEFRILMLLGKFLLSPTPCGKDRAAGIA